MCPKLTGFRHIVQNAGGRNGRSRIHLRHNASGRRTVARMQHVRTREVTDGTQTGGAGRRYPRSRLPHRLTGRLRSGRRDQQRIPVGAGGGTRQSLHARCRTGRPRSGARKTSAHPHLHRNQRDSPEVQAAEVAAGSVGQRRGGRRTGAPVHGRRGVFGGRRHAYRPRLPRGDVAGRGGGGGTHREPARHRGLLASGRVRAFHRANRKGSGRRRHCERALPRRSGPRHRELPCGRSLGRAAG